MIKISAPLVDRNTGDIIPASDHNDVKDYIEDGIYRVNTLSLNIGGTEIIDSSGNITTDVGTVDGIDIATDVAANTLKDTNVSTNLSLGTITSTTMDVNSSDGTNATLIAADTDDAGLLTATKFDEIVANTSAKHTQNTDTALGSGAVAADHGTATTDQIVNVCYGTSETPPTASTTTEGALYIQYTA